MENFYDILGVAQNSSQEEIKEKYKKLAFEFHPDRNNGSKEAEEKFKKITEAYQVLSNPQKKAEYDFQRKGGFPGFEGFQPDNGGVTEEMLWNFVNSMNNGGAWHGFQPVDGTIFNEKKKRPDPVIAINLTLKEVIQGKTVEQENVSLLRACENCHEQGFDKTKEKVACHACKGKGKVRAEGMNMFLNNQKIDMEVTCRACRGQKISFPICAECSGEGCLEEKGKIKFAVPIGAQYGSFIEAEVIKEEKDKDKNFKRPKIKILYTIPKDFSVERNGNVYTKKKISFPRASLGGNVKVKLLDETEGTIKIPPGIENGKILKLSGKGLPIGSGNKPGDLLFQIEIESPREPKTKEETEILEKLNKLYEEQTQ